VPTQRFPVRRNFCSEIFFPRQNVSRSALGGGANNLSAGGSSSSLAMVAASGSYEFLVMTPGVTISRGTAVRSAVVQGGVRNWSTAEVPGDSRVALPSESMGASLTPLGAPSTPWGAGESATIVGGG
jgi:hypothetical protein